MPRLILLLFIATILTGCITETIEDEPMVYGRVTEPKKVKVKKLKTSPPATETTTETPSWRPAN